MAHEGRARGEMGGGGKGGDGAPKSSLIWGDGGRCGEVAHGGRARGEMGWGHQRAVWEQQKVHWFTLLDSLKT